MTYTKTIIIPTDELEIINKFLEEEIQGEDNTIAYTAKFPNGNEMDIKCCGCDNDTSFTEAVLFDSEGSELCCTEVEFAILGEWEIEYDGNKYICEVKKEIEIKTKEELAEKYNIVGDDISIMHSNYETFIAFDSIDPEDAEALVYEEMASTYDFIGTYDEVLNYLCDTGLILSNYSELPSGKYVININC